MRNILCLILKLKKKIIKNIHIFFNAIKYFVNFFEMSFSYNSMKLFDIRFDVYVKKVFNMKTQYKIEN